jgi:hypothetical protein
VTIAFSGKSTVSILVMFQELALFGVTIESKETDIVGSGAIETVMAVHIIWSSGSPALAFLPDCRLISNDCERNSSNSGCRRISWFEQPRLGTTCNTHVVTADVESEVLVVVLVVVADDVRRMVSQLLTSKVSNSSNETSTSPNHAISPISKSDGR